LIRNMTNMKRKLLFGVLFVFATWAASSCDSLGKCQTCKYVIYENGSVVNPSASESEYCGADLIARQAKDDVTVGSQTTKFECR
jgi:hypothetical protein